MTYLRVRPSVSQIIIQPPIDFFYKAEPLGGGRNNSGHIIFRRAGGGVKRFLRLIDFKKVVWGVPFYIIRSDTDPTRTGFLFLVCFINGILSYTLATEGVDIEDEQCFITTSKPGFFFLGNTLTLSRISEGCSLHSLEKRLNFGGTIARAAGTTVTLLRKFKYNSILLRLPSKEEILLNEKTIATTGRVSNLNHKLKRYTGAGQLRRLGLRPVVRGVAQNPIDHPHGGGGGKPQVTAWSKIAKNKNTQKKKLFIKSHIFLSRKKLKKKRRK
jgi:large subunit ribosomal protein L2